MSARRLRLAVPSSVALVILLGLAASAGAANSSRTAAVARSATSTCQGAPKPGGTLVVGHQYDVANLNPLVSSNNGEILVQAEIFSGLIRVDPGGKDVIVPGLADKWSISKNGLVYTFHVRSDARFSNGAPVTAEDVKFSIDRFANPKLNQIFPSLATEIKNTTVVGPDTVQVHLVHPTGAFLQYMSLFPAFIVPKALVEKEGAAFFNHPVGSGPFEVQSWQRGSSITLVKNPYYWEKGKPYLNELQYQFITDDNTRILKLHANEIGVAESVPFLQIAALSKVSGVRVQSNPSTRQEVIWLNLHRAPLNDEKVRQAMSYAIDRAALNKVVYANTGQIPDSEFPKLQYNDNAIPPLAYNLTKAKALMKASSAPNGFTMTMLYPGGDSRISQLLTIVQQEWAAIGIKIQLQPLDEATVKSRLQAENYDMMVQQDLWSSDILAPDEFAFVFADPTKKTGIDGYFNGFKDLTIWKLVQEAGAGNEAQRTKLWPQIQKLWLKDMPWMSIMWLPTVSGIRSTVCDVPVNALGWYQFQDTWLSNA